MGRDPSSSTSALSGYEAKDFLFSRSRSSLKRSQWLTTPVYTGQQYPVSTTPLYDRSGISGPNATDSGLSPTTIFQLRCTQGYHRSASHRIIPGCTLLSFAPVSCLIPLSLLFPGFQTKLRDPHTLAAATKGNHSQRYEDAWSLVTRTLCAYYGLHIPLSDDQSHLASFTFMSLST